MRALDSNNSSYHITLYSENFKLPLASSSWPAELLNSDYDDDDAGCAAVLTSSPYQVELTQLQMERLRLEEERCRHLQMLRDVEAARGPLPRWSVCINVI